MSIYLDNGVSQDKSEVLTHLFLHYPLVDKSIHDELKQAILKFGGFNSWHEGYGVLLEEVNELWEEIKSKESDANKIYKEAIQVSAMALEIALYAALEVNK